MDQIDRQPSFDRHPSDEDLVCGLDGELSSAAQAAVDGHLRDCAPCRRRADGFAAASAAVSAVHRLDTAAEDVADVAASQASRARLRVALAATEAAPPDWVTSSWRDLAALPRVGLAVAAVAFTAFVVAFGPASSALARFRSSCPASDAASASLERDALPVAAFTPGATVNVSVAELCGSAASPSRRVLPASMRLEVVRAYGMQDVSADDYELDYLITPELGGAPVAANLWPERYSGHRWNAGVKDQLESLLPELVCKGEIDLQTAQRDIAGDWIAAYKKYFKTEYPIHRQASLEDDDRLEFEPFSAVARPALWTETDARAVAVLDVSRSR
ncbi:MAG: zf-HC2 domain-containing protein [Acidobacteriota bacterium]